MNVIVSKGPHFKEAEKKVYQYLNQVLAELAKQNERKGA